ncbi:hypothetical protein T01_14786 [Trichinella spiralis]|uniref:Uncharacterized protein n=1 Tax=Trichinella spiralis TaxID=6334 RepID=A0A0V1AL03_TRISP|nr:hypothetical protein T01_14786 [Trichinella spiralis]
MLFKEPVYKHKTHNEHQYKLWFEHFTSVLILLIQPVSDDVHSAVSVPTANLLYKYINERFQC